MIEQNEDELDDMEHHAAVDIPDINNIRAGMPCEEWVNIDTFRTREEALKWAQENLGADENGMICVISTF